MDRSKIKHFLFGEPFPTSMALHERLDKVRGLAVFASDPISSNAYATDGDASLASRFAPFDVLRGSLVTLVLTRCLATTELTSCSAGRATMA